MAIYSYVSGTIDLARRQADRVVSPHDRQKAYDSVLGFAQEQPLLFVRRITLPSPQPPCFLLSCFLAAPC